MTNFLCLTVISIPIMICHSTMGWIPLQFGCQLREVDCIWNMMAYAQKLDFVFRLNRWVHLNQWGHQFSRLLAPEVCASVVVMLVTPCSEVVLRVLATHSICQFPFTSPPMCHRISTGLYHHLICAHFCYTRSNEITPVINSQHWYKRWPS